MSESFDIEIGDETLHLVLERSPFTSTISSTFVHAGCPSCGEQYCCFSCDGSVKEPFETEEDVGTRLRLNATYDALENLVLFHAMQRLDVRSEAYLSGIKAMLDAVSIFYGDADE